MPIAAASLWQGISTATRGWLPGRPNRSRTMSRRIRNRRPAADGQGLFQDAASAIPPLIGVPMRSTRTTVAQMIVRSPPDCQVAMYSRSLSTRRTLLLRIRLAAPAAHLRETGHAGLDAMAGGVAVGDRLERPSAGAGAGRVRPRADQRHRRRQHVQQLRQFIERGAAQQRATRVTRGSWRVACRQIPFVPRVWCIVRNFSITNRLAVQSDTLLAEQRAGPLLVRRISRGDEEHRGSPSPPGRSTPGRYPVVRLTIKRRRRSIRAIARADKTNVGEGNRCRPEGHRELSRRTKS